jgi:hypothetical protein
MTLLTTFLVINLNGNGFNSPVNWHRLAGWIKRQDPTICYLQQMHLSDKDKIHLK